MGYLDEEQKNRILENNKLLSGRFIEEDRQAELERLRRDAEHIRKLIKKPRRTLAGYVIKKVTGEEPVTFVLKGITRAMGRKYRKNTRSKKRIADIFKKRR